MAQNIDCWLGSFVIFQGIRTSFAKKPHSFVLFGPPAPSPSRSARALLYEDISNSSTCSVVLFFTDCRYPG